MKNNYKKFASGVSVVALMLSIFLLLPLLAGCYEPVVLIDEETEPPKEIVYVSVANEGDIGKYDVQEWDGKYALSLVVKNEDILAPFDRFVAFGCVAFNDYLTVENMLRTFFISEADKDRIAHCIEHTKQLSGASLQCMIGLGEIGGEDYVYIRFRGLSLRCDQCAATPMLFKSNLDYTLASVVEALEMVVGEKLTDEYLSSTPLDGTYKNSTFGIEIGFYAGVNKGDFSLLDKYQKIEREAVLDGSDTTTKYVTFNSLSEYYYVVYQNEVYVVTRDMLMQR